MKLLKYLVVKMTIDELIEAAKCKPVTEEDIKAFEKRLRETEAEFAEEMEANKITNEWLNREYTI